MKTSLYRKNVYWLLLLLFCGCEVPYLPEVLDAPKRFLVVSGYINSGNAPTSLLLSRTRNLSEAGIPLPETGAQVMIEEEPAAVIANLKEVEPGNYTSDDVLQLNISKLYRLRIRAGGKEYLSAFFPVKVTPPIEYLDWEARADGLQIYVNTRDPQHNTRFYRWEFDETWEFTARYFSSHEYKDGQVVPRNSDWNIYQCWKSSVSTGIIIGSSIKLSQDIMQDMPLTWLPSNSEKHKLRYSILAKQYALTKEGFEYWDILKRNTESIGTLFDPMPSRLTGNIKCLSDPAEPVIGFIGASTVEEKRIFISVADLPENWIRPSNYCPVDTIEVHETRRYLQSGGHYLIAPYLKNGDPDSLLGYFISTRGCVDCTLTGTNIRPDFWR